MTDLASLPPDHALRNKPIRELKPLYRFRGDTLKPKDCAHWKIGRHSYNELDEFWGKLGEFLVEGTQ